ncbi:hypothetical protein [Flavobacterium sp. ASW18X]|uniref:hypothetical protein n=1 Tax=Flavobacterium sp. ASW18X TaxID=2572595 RepID=UPI0010AE773D|nr:hypothetical protein [Flavobacterium sp. ASW18X]TKD65908.1 hypothetical protein FBT53_03310 [Flavobacterium sp. ASW18X]
MRLSKLVYLLLITVLLNSVKTQAQKVWTGNLLTQDLKDFAAGHYTEVKGTITIQDFDGVDLRPLEGLQRCSGNIVISKNQKLESLKGLGNLQEVGGKIVIEKNPELYKFCSLTKQLLEHGIKGEEISKGIMDKIDINRNGYNPELINLLNKDCSYERFRDFCFSC